MQKLKKGIYGTLKKISGTRYFEVVDSFFWLLDYHDKEGWAIVAEKGFQSNFGSIPRLLWIFFDPTMYNIYILHDAAYASHMKYNLSTCEYQLVSKKEVDVMLLEGLKYEGAGYIERWLIYLAVRVFGFIAWNKN